MRRLFSRAALPFLVPAFLFAAFAAGCSKEEPASPPPVVKKPVPKAVAKAQESFQERINKAAETDPEIITIASDKTLPVSAAMAGWSPAVSPVATLRPLNFDGRWPGPSD